MMKDLLKFAIDVTISNSMESLSKDDGNDDARKQWSDWFNETNNRAARATGILVQFRWRRLSNDNVKFP